MKSKKVKRSKHQFEFVRAFIICLVVIGFVYPATSIADMQTVYVISIGDREVGCAASYDEAVEAYRLGRSAKNTESDSVTLISEEYSIEPKQGRKSKTLTVATLSEKVYSTLEDYIVEDKTLAYTVKINNYTVTLSTMDEVIELLEEAQAAYDVDNKFSVALTNLKDRETSVMTTSVYNASIENNSPMLVGLDSIRAKAIEIASSENSGDTTSEEGSTSTDAAADTEGEGQADGTGQETGGDTAGQAETQPQEDGIVNVDFAEDIQVLETYVSKDQISTKEQALEGITKDKEENQIYEVQAGDCLSAIASNHGMTVDDLLAINDGLTVDSNILIGDQIVVMVPKPELSILVDEQQTYTENYSKPIEYIDNPDVYVGNDTVITEGKEGSRTVTAIVSYKNGNEYNRNIINEVIIDEAVAKVIQRGTKALPTYIKPLSNGRLSSGFGARWGRTHLGVDWAVSTGSAVWASRSGTVESAGWMGSYGYCVVVNHGDGVKTRYAHLSKIEVSVGTYVKQGQRIALSGNTGNSTGPHLHFEVIVNGSVQNPLNYVK